MQDDCHEAVLCRINSGPGLPLPGHERGEWCEGKGPYHEGLVQDRVAYRSRGHLI